MPNYREYIEYQLPITLTAGMVYEVGFFVSPGDDMPFFSDRVGLHLSNGALSGMGTWTHLVGNPQPQIENPQGNLLNNLTGWTEITGLYTANGGETHLYIGNFADDANMMVVQNTAANGTFSPGDERTYLYIDDVYIRSSCFMDIEDTTICAGDSFEAIPVGQWDTFEWSTGSTNPTEVFDVAGEYWVTVENATCTYTDTFEVMVEALPVFSLGNDTTICPEAELILEAPASASSLNWWDGQQTMQVTVDGEGVYWLEVEENGCFFRDSIEVSEYVLPVLDLGNDTSVCVNSGFVLDATVSLVNSYLWSDGSEDPTFSVVEDGEYYVEVSVFECTLYDTIEVNVVAPPMPEPVDTSLCEGEVLSLDAGSWELADYLWSTGGTDQVEHFVQAGEYELEVSNFCGSELVEISIEEGMFCDCQLYVPNAVSPNGDGLNDVFRVVHECEFERYELQIYNRWGQRIFETSDPMQTWDASFQGETVKEDVYVWRISTESSVNGDVSLKNKTGHVTVVR